MVGLNTPAPPIAELDAQYAAIGRGAATVHAQATAPAHAPAAATTPAAPDSATSPRVDVRIGGRELNADEQHAVAELNTAIGNVTRVINGIPNEARMTLADGRTVSGQELREMWSKSEFIINDTTYTEYRNESDRGEADYNGGHPRISYNIDVLTDYSRTPGGMNYLALHEIGHMTVAGRQTNAEVHHDKVLTHAENEINERLANDVARGIAHHGRLPVLPATGISAPTQGGYSAEIPSFDTPAPSPPGESAPGPRR